MGSSACKFNLDSVLSLPLVKSTSYFGELFEQFIVVECIKQTSCKKTEYQFSYLMTESSLEIDLVVQKPIAYDFLDDLIIGFFLITQGL